MVTAVAPDARHIWRTKGRGRPTDAPPLKLPRPECPDQLRRTDLCFEETGQ